MARRAPVLRPTSEGRPSAKCEDVEVQGKGEGSDEDVVVVVFEGQ
jgi:hypothetical protein